LNARKKLPVVYIAADRLPQAQAAVQELLAKHSTYEWLPHALHEIVEQARDLNKTAQAGQVYREILNAQPGHSQAIWLKMGVTVTDVYLGNGQAVDAGVKDIIARHSTDPRAAESLAQIGWAYDKLNQYAKARPLYEYVVDNWSDKPRAIYAHTGLVRDCIRLRDKQAAQARLEQLAKRYATDAQLPNVLNEIARGYREAQMYQEARVISQRILDTYSGHDQCIWAQRDIILCDIAEHSQNAAEAGLQKLIKDYPDNGYLPYVLNEIAEGYRQGRMYQPAKSVSQYVLDNFPSSDQCLWAQRGIVLSDLALGNLDAAKAGIQQLEGRFAKQQGVIWATSEVAEMSSKLGRHEQARDLFQFNLSNCPDRDDTIWSLRGFVAESIALKDEASIDAGIQKLFSEYSASKNLPMAAVHIGMDLCKAGHPRASELFQYVIDKYPDHEQAMFAKACTGQVFLQRGQDSQAEAIYQKILADYANAPGLADALDLMAEGYYSEALSECGSPEDAVPQRAVERFEKALAKWQTAANLASATPHFAARVCYLTGMCLQRLKQYDKMIECYQTGGCPIDS
jgi:tetratricopeptide (TPR) repeat protein